MRASELDNTKPWYKEFWAWFIFTPLAAIMGVMSVLIYFAYSSKDSVVTDNYKKKGRMLEATFEAQGYAKELGLTGLLINIKNVHYLLVSAKQSVFAPSVALYVEHPFKQDLDATLALTLIKDEQRDDPQFKQALSLLEQKSDSQSRYYIYQVNDNNELTGKRYLRASYYSPLPASASTNSDQDSKLEVWRLSGEIHFDETSYTFLTP